MRTIIQSSLNKLDIVSREEFEAQKAVLERTRNKLQSLEQQLAELSEQINS